MGHVTLPFVALNLYREHNGECSQKRPRRLHSRKAQEVPRYGWKRCECFIYASGTLADGFKRKNTGQYEWAAAERVAAEWERLGSWSLRATPSIATSEQQAQSRISVDDATKAFLLKCESRRIADPTLRKYKTLVKQLLIFCETRGKLRLTQLNVDDMDEFYACWKDQPRARGRKLERLRAFVKFCLKRKWLTEDVVEDIQAPIGASTAADRSPFTDEELERIFRACDKLGEVRWKSGLGEGSWSGEDTRDFISLLVHTGLRISDTATFDLNTRLREGNQIFLRMHKTGEPLLTWIPDWLMARLKIRRQIHGNLIFKVGRSDRLETVTDGWRKKINRVFAIAQADGKFDQKPVPHRFRHTFCRILLERAVPVADVAELVGDTEEVVYKYYAKWVRERQERLTELLKLAFTDRPRLVAPNSSGRAS